MRSSRWVVNGCLFTLSGQVKVLEDASPATGLFAAIAASALLHSPQPQTIYPNVQIPSKFYCCGVIRVSGQVRLRAGWLGRVSHHSSPHRDVYPRLEPDRLRVLLYARENFGCLSEYFEHVEKTRSPGISLHSKVHARDGRARM